ncbi:MAG TPA: hypothetical protein VJ208_00310 [Candidatus Nanoarchaeia archaeon]|nr:hypothetical protein [Candidatus Nanoarchaeia archaeon]
MKKLTVLAVAGILGGSLAFGNGNSAEAVPCKKVVEELVDYLGDSAEKRELAVEAGLWTWYGDERGAVSTEEYDTCMIEQVEEKFPGYSIKIRKNDYPRNNGGTTYFFVKKEK